MQRTSLPQAFLTILAVALIAGGIHVSNDLQERTRYGERPAGPSVDVVQDIEPPPSEPVESVSTPEPLNPEETATRPATLEDWISSVRGHISRFPPGTPEYERFARALRFLFREDPASIEKAAAILAEDHTLEQFTHVLITGEIARFDDSGRADAALRGLLTHESASDSLKMNVISGLSSAGRISEAMFTELLRFARVPDHLGRLALEALGSLHQSAGIPDSLRQEFVRCAFARHAEYLQAADVEGVRSSLKVLCGLSSPESRSRVLSAFRHANPGVRTAAFRAWSAMDHPDRDETLIGALAAERDADVLVEAVETLYPGSGRRPETARVIEAILKLTREHGEERVRQAALGYFARRYDRSNPPPARVTESIQDTLRSDASQVNREYAEWILKSRFELKP